MLNSFAGTAAPRAGVKFRSSSHDPVTATWFKSIGIRHSHIEGVILVAADPGFDGVRSSAGEFNRRNGGRYSASVRLNILAHFCSGAETQKDTHFLQNRTQANCRAQVGSTRRSEFQRCLGAGPKSIDFVRNPDEANWRQSSRAKIRRLG